MDGALTFMVVDGPTGVQRGRAVASTVPPAEVESQVGRGETSVRGDK